MFGEQNRADAVDLEVAQQPIALDLLEAFFRLEGLLGLGCGFMQDADAVNHALKPIGLGLDLGDGLLDLGFVSDI